jgi:predicted anti-sigma-YlaC factor YlaD
MNAGPADTHSPHLDLENLTAKAAGQPMSARASEHLARCEECRAEANRWNLVADGVRGVTDATPAAAPPAHPRQPPSRRLRPHVVTRPVRRTLLAVGAASAAAVLIGVAGYEAGVVHIQIGNTPVTAGLTAVGGCAGLEQATGTLEQVSGGNLVIKPAGGQPLTVTTTASTQVDMSGALESYITDGATVAVVGFSSDGTTTAAVVHVGPPGKTSGSGSLTVRGTVADASGGGFTVVTSDGTRVPVTTSSHTIVVVSDANVSQLQPGATTMALGYPGPDGTLSAHGVVQPLVGPVQLTNGAHVSLHTNVRDCTPASLADALGKIVSGS